MNFVPVEGPASALPWEGEAGVEWIEVPDRIRIYLSRDLEEWTVISPEDFDLLDWLWYLDSRSLNKVGPAYAVRKTRIGGGGPGGRGLGRVVVHRLHQIIMKRKAPMPSLFHVPDHENRNSLDNRRENLRWATASENRINQDRS